MDAPRRLHRSHDRKIAGVCGGIAEYFAIDPTLVRVAFAALVLLSAGAGGLILYGILWLVMPGPEGQPTVLPGTGEAGNGALAVGLLLVIVGAVLLLQRIPLLWAFGVGLFRFSIPVAIIAVGLILLMSRSRR